MFRLRTNIQIDNENERGDTVTSNKDHVKLKTAPKVYKTLIGKHALKKFFMNELTEKHLQFQNFIEDDVEVRKAENFFENPF